ncbi:hypothetical protein LTR17_015704 [Elasticomyces elasticus]|nr:hypothetical protein LTR17_015704 [Elasticomyces elasticus]
MVSDIRAGLCQLCGDFVNLLRPSNQPEYNLHLYRKPYGRGDLSERVCHNLMCAVPVKDQTLEEMPEFHLDAPTIDWLFEMYPEAKDNHAIADLVFKGIQHGNTEEQTGPDPFEGGVDVLCKISIIPFVQDHNADTFVVHSEPSKASMCRPFEDESDLEPKWDIFCGSDIGGKFVEVLEEPAILTSCAKRDSTRPSWSPMSARSSSCTASQ